MGTVFIYFLLAASAFWGAAPAPAPIQPASFSLPSSFSVTPAVVLQGDPFMVQVENAEIASIKKLTFDGKNLGVFMYQGKLSPPVPQDF